MKAKGFWLALVIALILPLAAIAPACSGDDDDDDDDADDDDADDDDATDDDTADDDTADDDTADDDTTDDDTGDDDTDDDDDAATVEDVCDKIFELCEDDWGWPSLDECYELFMTDCVDEAGYFECVADCLDAADCDAFGACEHPCWDDYCM